MGAALIKRKGLLTGLVQIGVAVATVAFTLPGYADKPRTTVADLRYGVVLYEYFQGKHFDSLTELMIAKERGGIQGHKDNPELIEGSLNLAYGMDRNAGLIFDRLLQENRPLSVRNAAWFYLSKIRYQRGEYDGVRQSISKISKPSKDLIDEIKAMEVQLLMREQNFEAADKALKAANKEVKSKGQFQYWRPYLQFNLGAIYARQERMKDAQAFFTKVTRSRLSTNPAFHQEQLALYDKAFTAAGYGYFDEENYKAAIAEFGNVRQFAPLANDALLGYGWAKARLGDYKAALGPWQLLSQKPMAGDAVQEALLAIPYAYLQLGDIAKAIDGYTRAEQQFIKELDYIDAAGADVLGKSIVELLDLNNQERDYSWLAPQRNSLVTSPSRYLLSLYSLNRFQNSVQTLSDLHDIRQRLDDWTLNLDAYDDLMDYRLRTFRRQQTPEGFMDMSSALQKLTKQQRDLSAAISQAREQKNVFLFLDEDRLDLLDMVESGERNSQVLAAAGEFVEEEERWLKRYRGILLWSATLDFDKRLWQIESDLKLSSGALSSAERAQQNIQKLLTEAPEIARAQLRIEKNRQQIDQLLANNTQVMATIEAELRTQIFAALALQRKRVQFYLGEARLAVAQLYDNEYLKGITEQ